MKVSDSKKSKELLLSHIEYLSKVRKGLSKDSTFVLKRKEDPKEIEMLEQTLYGISIRFLIDEKKNASDNKANIF